MSEIPVSSTPKTDPILLEGLAGVAISPLSLRRMFLQLTRLHYQSAENFGPFREKMANFIWKKDNTGLAIDYDFNYDPKQLDRRPLIVVGTSDFNFSKRAISNVIGVVEDRSGEAKLKLGHTSVIIRHIGGSPEDSLMMAEMTCQYYLGIQTMIQEQVKFNQFEVDRLITSRPFEKSSQQADQQFIADVIMSVVFNSIWLTLRESHRIKTIGFKQALEELSCDSLTK